MGCDAGHLADEDTYVFRSLRDFDPGQLLDRKTVGDVVGDRGKIVETVRVRDELMIRARLGDFLVPPVQIAQLGDDRHDGLTIQAHKETEHAVRRRVLRTHVEDHLILEGIIENDRRILVLQG